MTVFGLVDGLEVHHEGFPVLVGDEGQRVSDHVHDAELDLGFREDRSNGLRKALEAVHTGDEDISSPVKRNRIRSAKTKSKGGAWNGYEGG